MSHQHQIETKGFDKVYNHGCVEVFDLGGMEAEVKIKLEFVIERKNEETMRDEIQEIVQKYAV